MGAGIMLNSASWKCIVATAVLAGLAGGVDGATIDMVTVGNPGNVGEPSGGTAATGPFRICGAVDYEYRIGKYEVTAGQYAEFLNSVAAEDTYELYNADMANLGEFYNGCNILRDGTAGSYSYTVAPDWADRPVNYVSWGDAARFANWMHNGQPTGGQDLTTTEDGSYLLNGVVDNGDLLAVTRKVDATWVIPSEDEWYKAAYHKNDGVTGNYFIYPTASDAAPDNVLLTPDPGNNANFDDDTGYTIGAPYYRTEVGAFENSESPYGTFDQGGNVREWNEDILFESGRGMRGSAYSVTSAHRLGASYRIEGGPTEEGRKLGFRVANIPEPSTAVLGMICVLCCVLWRMKSSQ